MLYTYYALEESIHLVCATFICIAIYQDVQIINYTLIARMPKRHDVDYTIYGYRVYQSSIYTCKILFPYLPTGQIYDLHRSFIGDLIGTDDLERYGSCSDK